MTKIVRVVEAFRTLQGEGFHSGTAAVFVRFAGCNLWSGEDDDRERDAIRTGAKCPRFCDTDFRRGDAHDAASLSRLVAELGEGGVRLIVFTGGEPLLTLSGDLLAHVHNALPNALVAIETNGTVKPRSGVLGQIDWICMSPKVPKDQLVLEQADEIKVVFPDYDPLEYESFNADHRFVSPCARPLSGTVGRSVVEADVVGRAAQFCVNNPRWRLSTQVHKLAGVM